MAIEANPDIADRIRRVFVHSLSLNMNPEELPKVRDLGSVAGLDSLAMLSFVAGLEAEFATEIEVDRLNIKFLGDLDALVDYFSGRVNAVS